jgi:hypothetical protein
MSEFDRRLHNDDDAWLDSCLRAQGLPEDFSEEDLAFARELGTLFPADQDELPPYFAQTLLDADNTRYQEAPRGLEQRTQARVFRRLKLRRRLFRSAKRNRWRLPSLLPPLHLHRSLVAFGMACLLFMLVSMLATGNAFANGLLFLFVGPHTGVVQSHTPQTEVSHQSEHKTTDEPEHLSLPDVQRLLHFPFYYAFEWPPNFHTESVSLIQRPGQEWTDGPILKLVATYNRPGIKPHGVGEIAIWQFKPRVKVVQSVSLGSVHELKVGPDGKAAIIVNGKWMPLQDSNAHKWVYNGYSELIFEKNGVIFWIQGDVRDGVTQDRLVSIAENLKPFDVEAALRYNAPFNHIWQTFDYPSWMQNAQLVDSDSSDGPYLIVPPPDYPPYPSNRVR